MPRITFLATKQDRFEPGKFFKTENVQRRIVLDYSPLGNEVDINIYIPRDILQPIMLPKHAEIKSDNGKVLVYQDTSNLMCTYEVETNPADNTIVRFSIIMTYPQIEYRYTI